MKIKKCQKCGGDTVSITYSPARYSTFGRRKIRDESLRVFCGTCGYMWMVPTLDRDPISTASSGDEAQ